MGGSAARRPKPWGLPTRGTLESLRPSSHVTAAERPWVLSLGKLESLLPSRMPRFCDFFFFFHFFLKWGLAHRNQMMTRSLCPPLGAEPGQP